MGDQGLDHENGGPVARTWLVNTSCALFKLPDRAAPDFG